VAGLAQARFRMGPNHLRAVPAGGVKMDFETGTSAKKKCYRPMPSGRRPDLKRREQMLKLGAAGLSLAEIGERLGPPTRPSANGSRHAACLLG
jgi:hypothetical protein